jgi:hypothetical protein
MPTLSPAHHHFTNSFGSRTCPFWPIFLKVQAQTEDWAMVLKDAGGRSTWSEPPGGQDDTKVLTWWFREDGFWAPNAEVQMYLTLVLSPLYPLLWGFS